MRLLLVILSFFGYFRLNHLRLSSTIVNFFCYSMLILAIVGYFTLGYLTLL
jgi:hypothetical protein